VLRVPFVVRGWCVVRGPIKELRAAAAMAAGRVIGAGLALALGLTACGGRAGGLTATPAATVTAGPPTATVDPWIELHQSTPYPFASPLPPAAASALDGVYVKDVPQTGPVVHCVRCPDYKPGPGQWKVSFDNGIMRIHHPASDWRGIASFVVEGDELVLFNDPACADVTGRYTWTLAEGQLVLAEVDDPCAIHMRALNLAQMAWGGCQPPNAEAAVSGHWLTPPGCE
jgi:hypothetical protein